jgi:urease accessory protein
MAELIKANIKYDAKRWLAKFSASFGYIDGCTRLGKTEHYGPLRVQRPFFPEGPACLHLYLLHPPGGLVGGDRLAVDLTVSAGAHVVMTTPSAGKIYRNISGLKQGQYTSIRVASKAVMEYFPQENIIFNGADGEIATQVDLTGDGLFIGWEIACLGMQASKEEFVKGALKLSLVIQQDGKPLFFDRLKIESPSALQSSKAGLQGRSVIGTLVITTTVVNADNEEKIIAWQQQINQCDSDKHSSCSVATTQKPDVFVVRMLSDNSESVRRSFEALWAILRPQVINKNACRPRIWNT